MHMDDAKGMNTRIEQEVVVRQLKEFEVIVEVVWAEIASAPMNELGPC